jgi:hypothetical protein
MTSIQVGFLELAVVRLDHAKRASPDDDTPQRDRRGLAK